MISRKMLKITLLSSALLLSATSALANHHESGEADEKRPQREHSFAQWDTDQDGKISFEEFAGRERPEREGLEQFDGNSDGVLERTELDDHLASRHQEARARAHERFEDLDQDGDGKITREEAHRAAFQRLDQDDDGFISDNEMRAGRDRLHDRMRRDRDREQGRGRRHEGHEQGGRAMGRDHR
jgi:Ca2+-binding EF-hand superfamily protein